jgi:uncharacterized protein YdeI (YjbR/CyaY-like superfamily)
MGKFGDGLKMVTARSRAQWRRWLAKNHQSCCGVWLCYYKKGSGRASVSYAEAVEEALCFGWIDSKINSLDAERWRQVFTPRKAGSKWSKVNKGRIEQLVAAGRMTKAGLAKIEAAKRDGSWKTLERVDSLEVPEELQKALDAHGTAAKNFAAFSPSHRKQYLYWINDAKRPETRERRIRETVRRVGENHKPRM